MRCEYEWDHEIIQFVCSFPHSHSLTAGLLLCLRRRRRRRTYKEYHFIFHSGQSVRLTLCMCLAICLAHSSTCATHASIYRCGIGIVCVCDAPIPNIHERDANRFGICYTLTHRFSFRIHCVKLIAILFFQFAFEWAGIK